MAKKRISQVPGLYHVNACAVADTLLFRDAIDYRRCVDLLADGVARGMFRCHEFCLMSTHYHALLSVDDDRLPKAMQRIDRRYALRYNNRWLRQGRLFDAPYHPELVETDEHALECIRYIALNPEVPGLARAELWPWSSYGDLIGLRNDFPWVDPEPLLAYFGGGDQARQRIVEFVDAGRERRLLAA